MHILPKIGKYESLLNFHFLSQNFDAQTIFPSWHGPADIITVIKGLNHLNCVSSKGLPIFGFGVERIPLSIARCFACVAIRFEQSNFDISFLRLHDGAKSVKMDIFSLLLSISLNLVMKD